MNTSSWRLFVTTIATVLALGLVGNAHAARNFFDGNSISNYSVCPITGNIVSVLSLVAGYYTDPAEPFPQTGDIAYVRGYVGNASPCHSDAAGLEFQLPEGANYAIDATYKVECVIGKFDGTVRENVVNGPNGNCAQTPSPGPMGGAQFGWATLPGGWYLEIRVPVRFDKKLLGLAGPNTHKLYVGASSAYGNIVAEQAVTVFASGASFDALQTSNVTTSSAEMSFNINNHYATGSLFVDYGSSPTFGNSLAPVTIPGTAASFPITANLTGLNPNTTHYWRARFVSTDGTFSSTTQSFTTQAAPASNFALTVAKNGTGAGTVSSAPAGINCGSTCSASYAQDTTVALTATPAAGSGFAGWSGACTGAGACNVTMSAAKSVTATFNTNAPTVGSLTVTLAGLPNGTSSDLLLRKPDGTTQTHPTLVRTGFNLSDVPPGAYSVTAPNITVAGTTYSAPTQSATVVAGSTATINVVYSATPTFVLTVTKAGTGGGAISSNPASINCGTTCSATYTQNTVVSLAATPAADSAFAGWSGACTGTGSCNVTMNAAKSVTATFNANAPTLGSLAVTLAGLPVGTSSNLVLGKPDGTTQTYTVLVGTGFSLSDVAPGTYSVTAPDIVVGGATYRAPAQSATVVAGSSATINTVYGTTPSFALTATKNGTGSGTVSSSPTGIDCGATCSATYTQNTVVNLTATPATGSSFAGWSGACTGTSPCTVTMNAAKSVNAQFTLVAVTPPPASLSVAASTTPASTTAQKASNNNLALVLPTNVTGTVKLEAVTLGANGTGNDALDIANVALRLDANNNGSIDASDPVLAQGKFASNDGQTTLTLATPQTLSGNQNILVAVDFQSNLAGLSGTALFGSAALLFLAMRNKRRRLLLAATALSLALTACPSTPPTPDTMTYQLSVKAVTAKDANNASVGATGLPVAGTTLKVQK